MQIMQQKVPPEMLEKLGCIQRSVSLELLGLSLMSYLRGWICYAEKTLGSYILPYISSVKSPQQAIGATIKHHICHKMGLKCKQFSEAWSFLLSSTGEWKEF